MGRMILSANRLTTSRAAQAQPPQLPPSHRVVNFWALFILLPKRMPTGSTPSWACESQEGSGTSVVEEVRDPAPVQQITEHVR